MISIQNAFLMVSILLTAAVVYFGIPVLRQVSHLFRFDTNGKNSHGIHRRYVSNFGGIALFASISIGFSLSGYSDLLVGYPFIFGSLLMLFFTGLKDDIFVLAPKTKLLVQIVASTIVIFGANLRIDHFYGLFGLQELNMVMSIFVTLFTMIVVMNAFNLVDGIDGLAAGTGIISSVFFGAGFFVAGEFSYAVLTLMISVSLLVFLIYNTEPAKIFMGDSGSLTIGFLLALLAVKFTGLNDIEAYAEFAGQTSHLFAAAFLVLPLYDTIRIFIRRVAKKESPILPDNDHVHHSLMEDGFNHKKICIILHVGSIATILSIMLISRFDQHVIFFCLIVFSLMFFPTFRLKRKMLARIGLSKWFLSTSQGQNLDTKYFQHQTNTESETNSTNTNPKANTSEMHFKKSSVGR